VIRAFDFSRTYLFVFFVLGFTLITTEGFQNWSMKACALSLTSALTLAILFGCFDWLSRHFSLRALNVFVLGSMIGYLFSWTFMTCLDHLTAWTPMLLPGSKLLACLKFSLLMFGVYFGISLVARASDELYMSIPLIRFRFQNNKKKDLLADQTALVDNRLLDLAGSGMLDHRLVIPLHLVKEFRDKLGHHEESIRYRARKALDMISSLEMLPRLHLRIYETDYPEVKDPVYKLMKIARAIDADILTSSHEPNTLTQLEDIRFINLNALSAAIQPPVSTGEQIDIHIRKQGKDISQGIGFLEDGSMVVVNGAGPYVGQVVPCFILSVKRSMSGRLVFANLLETRLAQGKVMSPITANSGAPLDTSAIVELLAKTQKTH
jgi:uncharacterized protein YacL